MQTSAEPLCLSKCKSNIRLESLVKVQRSTSFVAFSYFASEMEKGLDAV